MKTNSLLMERWLNIPIYSFSCDEFPKTKWKLELSKNYKPKQLDRTVLRNNSIVYVKKNNNIIPFPLSSYENRNEAENENDNSVPYYKVSFLKSVLQKSIRRQDLYCAITSAKQIYLQEPIQLIRRLLIIMVEDVVFVENWFQTLCWLTCQKQFSERQAEWIMGVVYWLCLYHKKHVYSGCLSRNLNLSIKLRKKYGGMKFDMNLISNLRTGIINKEHKYIKLTSIPDFEIDPRNKTSKSAIDFHISKINYYVEDKTGIDKEIVKTLIWKFRSSFNCREKRIWCFCKECEHCREYELYKEIEREVDKYSYFRLKSMLED